MLVCPNQAKFPNCPKCNHPRLKDVALAKPNEVGLPVETGPIVVTSGTGIGIAIGIDYKVENIFPKRIYKSPTSTATPTPIPIPKGFCYKRLA